MLLTMSPGLLASPSGKFSELGTITFKLMGSSSSAVANKAPITLAEPHMSYFISSILPAGFNEMPPASKVKPLPTNTCGFSSALAAP